MRSLHESEMWHKIKSRLARYEEEPEDNWDAIIKSLPNKPTSSNTRSKLLWVLMVLLLGWLVLPATYTSSPLSDTQAGLADQTGETSLAEESGAKELNANNSAHTNDSLPTINRRLNEADSVDHYSGEFTAADAAEPEFSAGYSRSATRFGHLDRDGGDPTADAGEDSAAPVDLGSVALYTPDEPANGVANRGRSHEPPSVAISPAKAGPEGDSIFVNIANDTVKTKTASSKSKSRKKRSFSVYFSLTPTMSYHKIIPNKRDQVELKELKSQGIFSHDRLGFCVDVGARKIISKKLEWFVGAAYAVQNQSFGYTYVSDEISAIESGADSDYTITPAVKSESVKQTSHNVHLSSGLLYTVKNATLVQQAGLGLEYAYNLSSLQSEGSDHTPNNAYAMVNFMYRFKWNFAEHFDFYIQPQFTHAINSQENSNHLYSIKPSRAGVGIGAIYHFQKVR